MKYLIAFIIVCILVTGAVGCSIESPTINTTSPTTISQSPGQPIEVVSVLDTYQSGQTVNPGGPSIEIILENISNEDIISLNVTLEESGPRSFDFGLVVASIKPMAPHERISSEKSLIGGGWGDGVPYSLMITGTMESGEVFTFTWEPSD